MYKSKDKNMFIIKWYGSITVHVKMYLYGSLILYCNYNDTALQILSKLTWKKKCHTLFSNKDRLGQDKYYQLFLKIINS